MSLDTDIVQTSPYTCNYVSRGCHCRHAKFTPLEQQLNRRASLVPEVQFYIWRDHLGHIECPSA